MGLNIPPAVNYQNPMNSVPALFAKTPPEGARLVPVEIDWVAMGGPNDCVAINLFGQAAATISQIVALSIDNSNCAVDVTFAFPDTSQTYVIPAFEPSITLPVFTNATNLFVYAPGASDSDFTRFAILNTMPPPLAAPLSVEQQIEVFDDVPVASGNTQIIANTLDGVIQAIDVSFQFVATACNVKWQLADGNGKVLAGGQAGATPIPNTNAYVKSFNMSGLNIRFSNGVVFTQTVSGSGTSALATVNVFTR